MIRLIEARNYKSLKFISITLDEFHVLIGANATGKSTFLDVIKFLSDIINLGIDKAVSDRAAYFDELTFGGKGGDIEFAIEVLFPAHVKEKFNGRSFSTIRYEIKIGITQDTSENAIKEERVWLLTPDPKIKIETTQRTLFPEILSEPATILSEKGKFKFKNFKRVISSNKIEGKKSDNFYIETQEASGKGWLPSFKFGIKKSALGNLPEDETKFPASTWLKSFLQQGVQLFILNSLDIRQPSAPGQSLHFKTDGSNLPWVIENLRKNRKRFIQWIEHIKTALPDIEDITTVEREEDRRRYLKIKYENGIEVPSWLVSDGTLRLLALTIPAYIDGIQGVYLIEEPENGIHPKAIECVYQSMSSVYDAQILLASHSPVILSMLNPKDLLCFGKTKEGITDIVRGINHPRLREWKGNPNLYLLFANGILS
jgi:predicted ATPase